MLEIIAVDFDGTLAQYQHYQGPDVVGAPIAAMVTRVKDWLRSGKNVVIFTARVSVDNPDAPIARIAIARWCEEHLGQVLPITSDKSYQITALWDDRAIQVMPNTGYPIQNVLAEALNALRNLLDDPSPTSTRRARAIVDVFADEEYSRFL